MADTNMMRMPPSSREMSGAMAIVGVGETDYHDDYQRQREKAPGYEPPGPEALASLAFERALADSGLKRSDIDGLSLSFLYGGPNAAELAPQLGLAPEYVSPGGGGIMCTVLANAASEIASGKCRTMAMIYAVASKSIGRQYGGSTYQSMGGAPASYYYYLPWGWSSQAAHWAMVFTQYQQRYGATEADLGEIAVQLRRNAIASPSAVMRAPMTIEDYLASRYIVRPLHLFDMCLVNDGAVCLIVTEADRARDLPHAPVLLTGWGESYVKTRKMEALVGDRLRTQMQAAGAQALEMAGASLGDIQHLEAYDPASIHLVNQLEGYGFVKPGEGLDFCRSGGMAVGGRLPVNTAGGMMSGSYMHGWNLVAEIAQQLRHEAGERQIPGIEMSMYSIAQTDQAHPMIFRRGG